MECSEGTLNWSPLNTTLAYISQSGGVALMRSLGKPATHAERERAISMLTLAASLRSISLRRGSVRPRSRAASVIRVTDARGA